MSEQRGGARALSGRQIARAAGIVMLAYVASGILGIVRQAAISSAFGAGARLDAFVAAQRVPETLFVLVAGGALGSAFIPVLRASWRRTTRPGRSGWRMP